MKYVPIPIAMLEVGKPLPVNVWSPGGQLLLRRGQPIVSEQHREKLHAFDASSTDVDAMAWQRAYERMVHMMLRDGVSLHLIATMPMPSEILQRDYVAGEQLSGGWLDLQEVLRGILYQGGLAINPLLRLTSIEMKARELLRADPDDSLFCLFQAISDNALGYCATHALLCAVVCELTAHKLGLEEFQRKPLFSAALTMNIGMARDQDSMSRQSDAPNTAQRMLIRNHPQKSADILQGFDIEDPDQLDIVLWHHTPEAGEGLARNLACRRLLHLADTFVARTAGRKTRASQSAVKAVKSMVLGAQGDGIGVSSAMAQAVGFYPPGSYVQLTNGETAVAVRRGERANTPWVISILDKDAMPITRYAAKNTAEPAHAIEAPVNFEKVRVTVNLEKVRRVTERLPKAR
jgi:HD-GYP domain-containing protein (c-di-GMP phosphodiesterase class II)